MEDCKELLYHNPLELQDKINCFLSEDHYYRGKLALSYYKDSQRVGEYVIFPINFSRNFFVMGIDDTTGKIFVRLINGDLSLIFEKGIREDSKIQKLKNLMGFTHHKWEVTSLKKGQIIRIQGDFAVRIIKTFASLDKLLNYLSFFPGIGVNDIRSILWEEFIKKYLSEDEELKEIERLLNVLDEIRRIRRINSMIGVKERETIKVEEEVKQKLRELLGVKRIPERNRIYFMKVSKIKNKFKEFIVNKEEKLKMYYGHYTSPHLVQVIGVLVGNQVIIMREQELVVTHKEHGISTFNISVPSIVEFGTLDNFSNITEPDFMDIIFI